jgi:type II secretory pathway pseudopilin PulG
VRARQHGFTYLGALFLIVLMGAALAGTGELWSTASLRAREKELLWVGSQYARALRRYYENSPDIKQYPQRLEELLEDQRRPTAQRHLRRLYPDPITRSSEWGLILGSDGRIVGVHSLASTPPLKRGQFPPEWSGFDGVASYTEWQFLADRAFSNIPPNPGKSSPDKSPPIPAPAGAATRPLADVTNSATGVAGASPFNPPR